MNWKDKLKRTALHVASRVGNVDVSNVLIENDADMNAVDKKNNTPLYLSTHPLTQLMPRHFAVTLQLLCFGATNTSSCRLRLCSRDGSVLNDCVDNFSMISETVC